MLCGLQQRSWQFESGLSVLSDAHRGMDPSQSAMLQEEQRLHGLPAFWQHQHFVRQQQLHQQQQTLYEMQQQQRHQQQAALWHAQAQGLSSRGPPMAPLPWQGQNMTTHPHAPPPEHPAPPSQQQQPQPQQPPLPSHLAQYARALWGDHGPEVGALRGWWEAQYNLASRGVASSSPASISQSCHTSPPSTSPVSSPPPPWIPNPGQWEAKAPALAQASKRPRSPEAQEAAEASEGPPARCARRAGEEGEAAGDQRGEAGEAPPTTPAPPNVSSEEKSPCVYTDILLPFDCTCSSLCGVKQACHHS